MQRRKCCVLWWMLLCFVYQSSDGLDSHKQCTPRSTSILDSHISEKVSHISEDAVSSVIRLNQSVSPLQRFQKATDDLRKEYTEGNHDRIVNAIMNLEKVLEETVVNETTYLNDNEIAAGLWKPTGFVGALEIYASDSEVRYKTDVPDRKVEVHLPKELVDGQNTIVFCKINLPNDTHLNYSDKLYEHKLFGLSVNGTNTSGFKERVNITVNITAGINKTLKPQCVYLDMKGFKSDGCWTLWENDQNHVTCSCDHLTYFGVLMVSVGNLPSSDQKVLSYISIVGCSISLFALVITVLIFITNRQLRVDDSKKIHISLSVALILLNIHFLPSEAVAASSLDGFCLYMALGLHYSLLATFSWMALEGLHLYLLLVKVFNIYIRRYLLKLSLVGWGVPAVIVSVVVIIKKDYYGHAPVDVSNPNGSAICYLTDDKVKMVTTVGVFGLVFLLNVIIFTLTIRWFVAARSNKKDEKGKRKAAKNEILTILSVMILLGITWGLIFFSFGPLTTPGLYAFCILNSLQGFFIFIYFILSLKKTKDSAAKTTSQTQTTSET